MSEATIFRALGNQRRLMLFRLVLRRPYCVQALSRITGLTESAISQQMRILRAAGLVTATKHGYHVHFAADASALSDVLRDLITEATNAVFNPDACHCAGTDPVCHCGGN